MSLEDQIVYYSRWQYSAVHMIVMLPEMTSVSKISQRLSISLSDVEEALDVLIRLDLLKKTDHGWTVKKQALHLENNSPLLKALHTQWRLKSVEAMSLIKSQKDLRYSGCVSLSKEDFEQIKEIMAQAIERTVATVIKSPEETLAVLNVDFFEL
jgi:uncharacterized protein (TIGR02147 family)